MPAREPAHGLVMVPQRSGAKAWIDPVAVTCIEGTNGPRIYLMGGHSYETSNELTAADILLLLEKE